MLTNAYLTVISALTSLLHDDARDERGDVPGWVMITLMSAALVVALLGLAMPALKAMFDQAITQVNNAAG